MTMRAAAAFGKIGLRGAMALEFALVLPALLLFVLGLMDVGRLIWTQTTLDRAVEAAARCGAVETSLCGSTATIQSYAVGQAFGLVVPSADFSVATVGCGVQVSATMPFIFIIPWLTTSTISLGAKACYPT
jgi:uncharacterized membrane protein